MEGYFPSASYFWHDNKVFDWFIDFSGIIDAYSAEHEVLKFAVNSTSGLSNSSISLKTFSVSEKINLYNQGKLLNVLT